MTAELPQTVPDLVYALMPTLAEDLIGELAAGGTPLDIVRAMATGTATPSIKGLIRMRVGYETATLLEAAGLVGTEIREWWMGPRTLNSQGEDASPVGLMRHGQLKDATRTILAAARAEGRSPTPPFTWGVTNLVLLDIDGVLLPFAGWASEVQAEDFVSFEYFQPPLARPAQYFVDPAVLEAVRRWAATPHILVNWLSSWGPYVDLLAPQLDLPRLGSFAMRSEVDAYRQRPWKRLSLWSFISDELPAGHPIRLLAIDDRDLHGAGKQLRGMRSEKLIDSLVIEPLSSRGLTHAQLAQAQEFLMRGQSVTEDDPTDAPSVYVPAPAALAAAIRDGRKVKHFTQAQLAVAAGVSRHRIAELEAGRMRAEDLAAAVAVFKALDIHAVALPGVATTRKLEDVDLAEHVRRFGPDS